MTVHAAPDTHIYLHIPTPLFKARINMPGTITYPVTALTFDTVTLGAFGDIEHDMTLVLGTADGLDDLGRTRVQKIATSTQIPVARVSRGVEDGSLEIVDNAHITIYADDFRVWSKLPYQDPNGVDYKDGDVPVLDYLTDIPPVVNMGGNFADYIDPISDVITVTFDASLSYAMAEGATISTWAWNIGSGTLIAGALDEDSVTIEFEAGLHVVALTIVDSNGVANTGRRCAVGIDPANDVTIQTVSAPSYRFTQAGQSVQIGFPGDIPRSIYPDGTLCLIWHGAPSSPSDRSHMRFIGWHQSDDAAIRAMREGLHRETTLECVDVAGRLDSLPGFPQALQREAEDDVDIMWSLMPDLDINKALHYLAFWHSTALGVADFFLPPDGDDYPSMRLDSTGATLYDQLNSRAVSMCPDHILTCNAQGQLSFLADWQTMDVGDRPTVAAVLTEDDYSDLSWPYQRPPKVHVLRASAVVCSTEWIMLGGEKTLPLAFSIAPGTAFSQGTSEAEEAEGLTQSQEQLNVNTGHRYARLNARFGPLRVKLLDPTTFMDFQPALMNRIQLNIASQYAAQRGLPFTQTNAMVKELNISTVTGKTGTAIEADAVLELETSGPPAVTHVPETTGDPDDYETPAPPPPTAPPGSGLTDGVEQLVGIGINGHVYRTVNFQNATPTYDDVDLGIGTVYSWVVDPFSPGYAPGATSGSVDGWLVTETDIYRVVDLFGTPVATSVHTFPTPTVAANFHWRTIQASFGAYFAAGANPWLVCVSYYGDTLDHTGTWATYSTDGGLTWAAEWQLSNDYAFAVPTRFNPIALFTSPRTPGKAYTAAYVEGYVGPDILWVTYEGALGVGSIGPSGQVLSISSGGGAGSVIDKYLWCCPPPNTKRMIVEGIWVSTYESPSGGSCNSNVDILDDTTTTLVDDLSHAVPTPNTIDNAFTTGAFTATFTFPTFASADWPVNTSNYLTGGNSSASRFRAYSDTTGAATCTTAINARVTELELDDGTIYYPSAGLADGFYTHDWGAHWVPTELIVPGKALAGSIHIPWLNPGEDIIYHGHFDDTINRAFRLMRSAGGVAVDISPDDGGVLFGVNRGPFGVRTYDSDRTYLLLAGIGNDSNLDADDDLHGVFISDDEGATWATVVSPIADSGAPAGRPAFEAAFGGDSPDVIFIWGPAAYMGYSDDAGASVDDKSGNLAALGASGWVGIAGGVA